MPRFSLRTASAILLFAAVQPAATPADWTVSVQAVRISDDDGRRAPSLSPGQFADWLRFANEVFAPAHIRFEPSPRVEERQSTLLNSMTGVHDVLWADAKRQGNALAAEFPDKLLVLLRYGPGKDPTGAAFAGDDYDYIAMPSFMGQHCGHPHTDALAHEIGHFLGLSHTFAGDPFESVESAAAFQAASNRGRAAFDGDGLSDTAFDPGVRALECDRRPELVIAGERYVLPRANVMSYYDERRDLSPRQIGLARWVLKKRLSHAMAAPSNLAAQAPLEAQALHPSANGCRPAVQPMAPYGAGSWVGDDQLFCNGEDGASLSLAVPIERAGRYTVSLFLTQAPDFGRLTAAFDEDALRGAFDAYAPVVLPSGPVLLGTAGLSPGIHRLRLSIAGKDNRSTGFKFGVDAVELRPAP